MIVLLEVIQRVKKILSIQLGKEKIFDKELAFALEIDAQSLAVMKSRDIIPYKALAYFAKRQHISMNWILFGQQPIYLRDV